VARIVALLCLCGLLAAGCSSQSSPTGAGPDKGEVMREVGGLVSAYTGEFRKGPQKLADLARYEPGFPLGFEAVKSGEVVVVWGARMTIEEGGGTNTGTTDVVAYLKKVPAEGGPVLLQNGTVKEMTPGEFASAPKAR
jgi:hypothetical protein